MKEAVKSPMVIGPGYRREPPPKVVTSGSQGDCGCGKCGGSMDAKAVSKIVGSAVARPTAAIVQMSPSASSLWLLISAGIDVSRAFKEDLQGKSPSGALTWTENVYAAMTEHLLDGMRLDAKTGGWIFSGMSREALGPQTITPGMPSRPVLGDLRREMSDTVMWLLMGGCYGPSPRG